LYSNCPNSWSLPSRVKNQTLLPICPLHRAPEKGICFCCVISKTAFALVLALSCVLCLLRGQDKTARKLRALIDVGCLVSYVSNGGKTRQQDCRGPRGLSCVLCLQWEQDKTAGLPTLMWAVLCLVSHIGARQDSRTPEVNVGCLVSYVSRGGKTRQQDSPH
jgi:hypothetical protein